MLKAKEFEVLKTWIEEKIRIGKAAIGRELDSPYMDSLRRDSAAADDAARAGLVVDFAPTTGGPANQSESAS